MHAKASPGRCAIQRLAQLLVGAHAACHHQPVQTGLLERA